MRNLLTLLLICLIGWFLFTYKLTEVPPGINGDESTVALNAALLSKTGFDSEGRFLPIFAKTKNNPDWKHPITLYATTFVFKILDPSYFNLRMTSVLFALISAFLSYFCLKELINRKIALFGMFFFITTPIVMIQAHLAHDNIAPLPFILFWLLMLVKYTKNQNNKLLFLAGLSLGISIITYFGLRLIAPVFATLTIVYIYFLHYKNKNQFINSVKWFILGILPSLAILLIAKFYYPGSLLGQYRPYKIEDYQSLILPFISVFDPSFLFIRGDSTPYHSTGKHGMFLLATLPLFIFGLVNIIRDKKPIFIFILISFFLTPILFGLGSTIHRASRLLAMIPFYIVIVSLGLQAILGLKHRLLRAGLVVAILSLISLNFLDFVSDYWYQYPKRVQAEFAKPIHKVYNKLALTAKNNNLKPYVDYYLFRPYPDAEEFFKLIYFPEGLAEWYREKAIPPKSIILTDLNNIPSKEKVDIVRVENFDYYFIINRSENEI